jgi:rubrerythrin
MASTYLLLERAEQIERAAEQLYRALAERFDGAAQSLFRRLAEEEAQHAARIRLLGARYRHDSRLVASMDFDLALLDRLLVEAEEALATVVGGAWDGDPLAARQGVVELERRFCLVHAQVLSTEGHPELRTFFRQLAEQDQAHQELLGP